MSEELGSNGLRCRPGDLAKIVFSTDPLLLGRIVLVEAWGRHGRWDVTLMGEPTFGLEFGTLRPLITNKTSFRDSSLQPLNSFRHSTADNLVLLDSPVRLVIGSALR